MRPLFDRLDELVKNIGDASWEGIPKHLEQRLVEIPAQIMQHQSHLYERVSFILNIILGLWVLSSFYIFREYWSPLVSSMSENISIAMLPPYQWMSHPMAILIFLGVCCFGVLWFDMDNKRSEIH